MKTIDELMEKIPLDWRYRWCEAESCYCMGCVNKSGRLPYDKNDWQEWKSRNPNDHKTPDDHLIYQDPGPRKAAWEAWNKKPE